MNKFCKVLAVAVMTCAVAGLAACEKKKSEETPAPAASTSAPAPSGHPCACGTSAGGNTSSARQEVGNGSACSPCRVIADGASDSGSRSRAREKVGGALGAFTRDRRAAKRA